MLWAGRPGLFLIGTTYVVAASVFLGAVYVRESLTYAQEALAWATPWLVAVALWALLAAQVDGGSSESGWLLELWLGLAIATPGYLVWQLLALAVRQVMAGAAPVRYDVSRDRPTPTHGSHPTARSGDTRTEERGGFGVPGAPNPPGCSATPRWCRN